MKSMGWNVERYPANAPNNHVGQGCRQVRFSVRWGRRVEIRKSSGVVTDIPNVTSAGVGLSDCLMPRSNAFDSAEPSHSRTPRARPPFIRESREMRTRPKVMPMLSSSATVTSDSPRATSAARTQAVQATVPGQQSVPDKPGEQTDQHPDASQACRRLRQTIAEQGRLSPRFDSDPQD